MTRIAALRAFTPACVLGRCRPRRRWRWASERRVCRQVAGHGDAAARFACQRNPTAVHLHERTHERKAKARAAAIARLEGVKRARLLLVSHAFAGIGHGEPHYAVKALG